MPPSVRKNLMPKAGETPITTSVGEVPTFAGPIVSESDVGRGVTRELFLLREHRLAVEHVTDRVDLLPPRLGETVAGTGAEVVVRVVDGGEDFSVADDRRRLQIVAGDSELHEPEQAFRLLLEATLGKCLDDVDDVDAARLDLLGDQRDIARPVAFGLIRA